MLDLPEKPFLPILPMAELVAQDAKGAGGVTKLLGGLSRGKAFDEIGPQGFVLALKGVDGLQEEAGFFEVCCYLFTSTYNHISMIAILAGDATYCGCYFMLSLYMAMNFGVFRDNHIMKEMVNRFRSR
jgi:hypothetical protein